MEMELNTKWKEENPLKKYFFSVAIISCLILSEESHLGQQKINFREVVWIFMQLTGGFIIQTIGC